LPGQRGIRGRVSGGKELLRKAVWKGTGKAEAGFSKGKAK